VAGYERRRNRKRRVGRGRIGRIRTIGRGGGMEETSEEEGKAI
jgi:hypothetical protein